VGKFDPLHYNARNSLVVGASENAAVFNYHAPNSLRNTATFSIFLAAVAYLAISGLTAAWEEFFKKFDAVHHLAMVYQDETAEGEKSSFCNFVERETATRNGTVHRLSKEP
jgi:hypothetical protein